MTAIRVPLRHLGKGGPKVPALGFGLMGLSGSYGAIPSDEDRFKILDRAVELGATFWDSSDRYGDNEELIGKWFKRTGLREKIFIATKYGVIGFDRFDSSYNYTKQACQKSLETLGIDSIDLYYAARLNYDTPIEETMRALAELKAEGKIKNIGLSEVTSATLRRAVKIAPVACVQIEYAAFTRDIENEKGTNLLATCRELGVSVVCYSPLGRGILTDTFTNKMDEPAIPRDFREEHFPRFSGENRDINIKFVKGFKALADKKGCNVTQLALAWLLKQGDDVIPIPGTTKIKYLEQNWASLNVQLTDGDEAEIRKYVETTELAGGRQQEKYGNLITGLCDTVEES